MIRLTVGDLLDDKELEWEDEWRHHLYIVKADAAILYIGQSRCPIERLWNHLGTGPMSYLGMSNLGRLVEANLPASRSWQVELLTLEDCETYTGQKAVSVIQAERGLLKACCPCLNRMRNPKQSPLPDNLIPYPGWRGRRKEDEINPGQASVR